jgi:hypothetical protein
VVGDLKTINRCHGTLLLSLAYALRIASRVDAEANTPRFAISPHYCGSTSEWVPRKKTVISRRGLRPITGIHLADIHAARQKRKQTMWESSGTLRQGRCAADLSTKDATDKGQCPNFRLEAGVAPGSRSVFKRVRCQLALGRRATPASKRGGTRVFQQPLNEELISN